MKLGFIGLGRMGEVMAPRIVAAGYPLLAWNRSPVKTPALAAAGVILGHTSREVFDACDIVLLMTDATGTRAVLSDVATLADRLVVVMGTQPPGDAIALEETVRRAGGRVLEVPMLGTVAPAAEGRLVALVGGERADLDVVRPVLEVLARRILHTGPVGTAATMKLAHNLLLSNYWTILGETLALASAGGIDAAVALDILIQSAAANGLLGLKAPVLRGEPCAVSFDVAGMANELAASSALAALFELSLPITALTTELAQHAVDGGAGGRDVAMLALHAQARAQSGASIFA